MKKSKQLHQLIHSMGKSEKRYFKVNSPKESSIYLKLFDAILDQEDYNPALLKVLLMVEKTLSPLTRLQHHLYDLLLKSLASFHAKHHPRYDVMEAIKHYTILRDRGLHQQGRALLQKGLKQAKENNYYGLVLEICNLMEDWVTEENDYKKAFKQKEELDNLHHRNNDYIESVTDLKEQVYQLRLFFLQHQFARNKEQKELLLGYLVTTKGALSKEQNLLRKRLLLTIHIYVYYGLQDFENLVDTEKKRLELLDENWSAAHISPFLAYAYHRNLWWILLSNKNYKEYENLVKNRKGNIAFSRLANSPFYTIKLAIAKEVTLVYAEIAQQHYHQAYHRIKDLWALYGKYPKHWDTNLSVRTFILFINTTFCLGKYEESLQWLNVFEQEISQNYTLPYRNMGKVASLLIHDGLGHTKFIENALESTRIRLYRKHNFFDVANVFLKYFKRQVKAKTPTAEKKLLVQYQAQMQQIAMQEEQKGFFILFNFVDWFDSKLQNCAIADLNNEF
jgi:hypothetical protein